MYTFIIHIAFFKKLQHFQFLLECVGAMHSV